MSQNRIKITQKEFDELYEISDKPEEKKKSEEDTQFEIYTEEYDKSEEVMEI